MKIIAKLADMIRDELDDAENYAKCAAVYKDDDQALSKMFSELSKQELNHANLEHEQAVRIIEDSEESAPASMQAVWDWEHEHMIDRVSRIKALLEMSK